MGRRKKKQTAQAPPPPSALTVTINPHPILPPASPALSRSKHLKGRAFTLIAAPLYRDRIWVVDNFLSAAECHAWISFGERVGLERTSQDQTPTHAFRCNDRAELRDPTVAQALWNRLSHLVPTSVAPRTAPGRTLTASGCNDKIRLYRYQQGHRFGKHVDESEFLESRRGETVMTGATVLIYLNGDASTAADSARGGEERHDHAGFADEAIAQGPPLCGGETAFYDGPGDDRKVLRFRPRQGSLLVHGHGNLCLTHEACEVESGTKYVLRTDVNYVVS